MSLIDSLSSGLGYAGDVEQKFGGRAIRGLLAGKPRELLSPIPFSDTLGITDPKQATSGSELATKLGISHSIANAAAGFGIDVATDPLSYFGGFGVAKAGGKAAKAAGLAGRPLAAGAVGDLSGIAKATEQASNFSKTKELRDSFALVKGLLPGPYGEGLESARGARLVGQRALVPTMGDAWRSPLVERATKQAAADPGLGGLTAPPWGRYASEGGMPATTGWSRFSPGEKSARHEAHHGMINAAVDLAMKNPQGFPISESGLNLPGRLVANTLKSGIKANNATLYGLGNIGQEMLGWGAEERGFLPQLKRMGEFMYHPAYHRGYDPQFRTIGPGAAAAYHALPGAVPGAVIGAGVGGEQGYEKGGLGGGIAGAALGGLGGATLGAGLSSMAYTPKFGGFSTNLPESAIKELADLDRARHGGSSSKVLRQYDRVSPFLEKQSPVNRFQRLSESAGIPFKMPKTQEDVLDLIGSKDLSKTLAAYDPYNKWTVPNIKNFPSEWSDTNAMNRLLSKAGNQFSTPLSDHLAMHEITHGLHHAQNLPENMYFFRNLNNEALGNISPNLAVDPEMWSKYQKQIPGLVSEYGSTFPTEFVAERNPQRIMAHIGDNLVGSQDMSRLYKALKGPKNPESLLNELDRMYGGDLNRALRGESASINPGARAMPPNPVDLGARKALEGANWEMASGAPERFSTDPTRRAYYAGERQARYAKRLGTPEPAVEKMKSALLERLKRGIGSGAGVLAGPLLGNLFGSSAEA